MHERFRAFKTAAANLQRQAAEEAQLDTSEAAQANVLEKVASWLDRLNSGGDALLVGAIMGRWFYDHTLSLLHLVPPSRWNVVPKLLRRLNPVEYARAQEIIAEIRSPRFDENTVRIMGNFSWLDNFRLSGFSREDAASTLALNFGSNLGDESLSAKSVEEKEMLLNCATQIDTALGLKSDGPVTCRAQLESEFEEAMK